ncbi:MAG: shikimate kinase [Bacteroidales bacterium]
MIESSEGLTVNQVFNEKGENIRQAEKNILRLTAGKGAGVIACGGGTPAFMTIWNL